MEVLSQVQISNDDGFDNFLVICQNTLCNLSPHKKKHIKGNNAPIMNETLCKEIMKISKLRDKYLKSGSEEDWLDKNELLFDLERRKCNR